MRSAKFGIRLRAEGLIVDRIPALLVSGASHTGKSTFAGSIGEACGWSVLSTDRIARHPGRPWPQVATHVAEFYSRLSDETIFQFLLQHHQNMWPAIRRLVCGLGAEKIPFVLEGSALRPEYVAGLAGAVTEVVHLYSEGEFLADRILRNSHYVELEPSQKHLVDKFVDRSLRDNELGLMAARGHGIQCIDVQDETTVERIRLQMVGRLSGGLV